MSQHTPGPWKAVRRIVGHCISDWNGDGGYVTEACFVRAGRHEWMIHGEDWKFGREHESTASEFICANARLIAAAPTLLDALKAIQSQCAGHSDEFSRSVWLLADGAIALAEGRDAGR